MNPSHTPNIKRHQLKKTPGLPKKVGHTIKQDFLVINCVSILHF
jgi:hypothetical protein